MLAGLTDALLVVVVFCIRICIYVACNLIVACLRQLPELVIAKSKKRLTP